MKNRNDHNSKSTLVRPLGYLALGLGATELFCHQPPHESRGCAARVRDVSREARPLEKVVLQPG
jgi:hypothetical protein